MCCCLHTQNERVFKENESDFVIPNVESLYTRKSPKMDTIFKSQYSYTIQRSNRAVEPYTNLWTCAET